MAKHDWRCSDCRRYVHEGVSTCRDCVNDKEQRERLRRDTDRRLDALLARHYDCDCMSCRPWTY